MANHYVMAWLFRGKRGYGAYSKGEGRRSGVVRLRTCVCVLIYLAILFEASKDNIPSDFSCETFSGY